jgi:hypothetical protein
MENLQSICMENTLLITKYLMFDFFDIKFDHSSYLKYFKNMKKLKYILLVFVFMAQGLSGFLVFMEIDNGIFTVDMYGEYVTPHQIFEV